MSVDFRPVIPDPDPTPGRGNYTDLQPFRFWCQKVLPLVYDESLSYYEVLCKTVDYLNKTMEDVGVLNGDIDSLYTAFTNLTGWTETQVNALLEAYTELQSYVNDYFDNLDVQQEINNKLDAMASDGTLSALILPFVTTQLPPIVTAWLDTHVTEPEGVVIDTSLTISGACADAKATGDAINGVKDTLDTVVESADLYTEVEVTGTKLNKVAWYQNTLVTSEGWAEAELYSVKFFDVSNAEFIRVTTNENLAENMKNHVSGASMSSIAIAGSKFGYTFKWMGVRAEQAKVIDDFFTMFGYQVNEVKHPDIYTRPHWNYLKTNGCAFGGSAPAEAVQALKRIHDRGITYWADHSEIGNYSLNNAPV